MFANTQLMGMNLGFPDVCLTPTPAGPIPIPYPNMTFGPMGFPAAYNVLTVCAPTHNLMTTIPLSLGDQPGISLGVASGMVMGPTRSLTGAFTVLVDGMPITRLTSMNIHNSTNCPGMRVIPSQPVLLVLAP